MMGLPHTLTAEHIDTTIRRYVRSVQGVGAAFDRASGIELLRRLKRETVGVGPYPGVALFEAANRIMTDLVILRGAKWLLAQNSPSCGQPWLRCRNSRVRADFRFIVANHDAVRASYAPKPRSGEFILFVNIDSGRAQVVPELSTPSSAPRG